VTAFFTGAQVSAAVEFFKNRLELIFNAAEPEVFFVEFVVAFFAEPEQAVFGVFFALEFDDQTYGVGSSAWLMGGVAGKQKKFTFFNGNVYGFAVFLDADYDVSLNLLVKFFAFVEMIVFAGVGATDCHDDHAGVFEDDFIAYRRFEEVTVFGDPFIYVNREV
jgi:hypothetical protein